MDASTLEWLTGRILAAVDGEQRPGAPALQFLLQRLSDAGRSDLAEPLGAALACELDDLDRHASDPGCENWLALFSDAAAVSDDPRLPAAVHALLPPVRLRWSLAGVGPAMRAVDATLTAVHLYPADSLAADAVDALERIVAGGYRPGQGVARDVGAPVFVPGDLGDHASAASALLNAYLLTDRLPYAMLADELMQSALRTLPERDPPFAEACATARVLCRLAALHRDPEYQRTAVLPPGADYAENAGRMLAALEAAVEGLGVEAAPFGLALAEWLDLQ